jgi:polyisoprenoid-binding protein YceI
MTIITNIKKFILLGILLSAASMPAFAEISDAPDGDLCAPFKDSRIDQSMVALMLKAATDGDLYRVKPGSSKMGFCINSPVGVVEAEFHSFQGGLALNDFMEQGTSLIHIDVDSLETDSGLVEMMLKSESFLDSEQFPEITFVSTGIEWIEGEKGVLKGNLTMHGVTKPVAFYVDLKKSETGDETVTVKATTTIQRSEFGMYTLSPMVDDRVSLCMTIDAYRYQS